MILTTTASTLRDPGTAPVGGQEDSGQGPAGQIVVDLSRLMWQWSFMVRLKLARETHHTISASILDALGRGFLIATAGVVAGALFGTAHLEALSLWTIAMAAASGVGCVIGSALVRNAACDPYEKEADGSSPALNTRKDVAEMPVMETARDVEPKQRWVRRMEMKGGQSERGTGRCI
jgi:hypothetical protein